MIEIKGNLWDHEDADIICITTNGTVKKNGRAVMGKGCALEAKEKYKDIDKVLGNLITQIGNQAFVVLGTFHRPRIVSFPTKHNWWEKSDLQLIEMSCQLLLDYVNEKDFKKIVLPRPGCGNGLLKWEVVKSILEKYFDDRFYIVSK